jgi:hypothetical protein
MGRISKVSVRFRQIRSPGLCTQNITERTVVGVSACRSAVSALLVARGVKFENIGTTHSAVANGLGIDVGTSADDNTKSSTLASFPLIHGNVVLPDIVSCHPSP